MSQLIDRWRPLRESMWVSADVTLAVGAIAIGLPEAWHATAVGFAFSRRHLVAGLEQGR